MARAVHFFSKNGWVQEASGVAARGLLTQPGDPSAAELHHPALEAQDTGPPPAQQTAYGSSKIGQSLGQSCWLCHFLLTSNALIRKEPPCNARLGCPLCPAKYICFPSSPPHSPTPPLSCIKWLPSRQPHWPWKDKEATRDGGFTCIFSTTQKWPRLS